MGVHLEVPDLAGEAVRAAQQPAVQDDAAADPDLAGEVHQVGRAGGDAGGVLGQGGEVRVVVHPYRQAQRAEHGGQPLGQGQLVPGQVGGERHDAAGDVHEPGDGDRDAGGGRSGPPHGLDGLPCHGREPPHGAVRAAAHRVVHDPALDQDPAAEVGAVDRDVVDVDLHAERADVRAVQGHRAPGAADCADVPDADLAYETPFQQLGHQVGDGGAVQPGRLGDVGAGQDPVVAQLAQHEREVRPAQRGRTRRWSAARGAIGWLVRHAHHLPLCLSLRSINRVVTRQCPTVNPSVA